LDTSGELIGIATSALTRVGAICVPLTTIDRIVNLLLERGRVSRGTLGLGLHDIHIPPGLREKLSLSNAAGVIVLGAEPDGPADQAGLMIGDILVALDGKPLEGTDDVQIALNEDSVGKSMKATAIRGGQLIDMMILVGESAHKH